MALLDTRRKLQSIVLLLFAAAVAYAKITGPDAGYTGAPGDLGNCTACHDTFHDPNVGPGSVSVGNVPSVYNPGQQYTLMVRVQQSGRRRFGFQLTAIDQFGNRAGTLAPLGSDTQINPETGVGGRQYIEHTEIGTLAPVTGSRVWSIQWTAPSTDIGTVGFWVAGNAANDDGTNQGDYIYTTRVSTDSQTSAVTVSLQSEPGGLTLQAGSHFTIGWNVSGVSNIDNIELRYSTDDGAMFPITNLIFFTTNPEITVYDWTVPNTPTTQAVIRVLVGKKSGDAVQTLSQVFTIAGDGTAPPPKISNASVSGKKLFVFGENFQMGAVVLLNGDEQATLNDDDFSHMLRCKKAGKKIAPGQTVALRVRNPDGSVSSSFSFTRPLE